MGLSWAPRLLDAIADSLDENGAAQSDTVERPLALVQELSRGIFDNMDG